MGWIPGWGRSPGGGHGNPLQYSCLENPMDRGAWWATIHRVANSGARLPWLSMHTWLIIFHGKCHKKRNQRIILKKIFLLEIWWIVAIWVGVQITSIRRQRGWSDYWSPCRLLSPPLIRSSCATGKGWLWGENVQRVPECPSPISPLYWHCT